MNIVNIIGIVIFCGIVGLSLLAVLEVLFASPRSRQRHGANHWKRRLARARSCIAGNRATARHQRRARSARHGGGSA
jgi:hypothetical protein